MVRVGVRKFAVESARAVCAGKQSARMALRARATARHGRLRPAAARADETAADDSMVAALEASAVRRSLPKSVWPFDAGAPELGAPSSPPPTRT